MSEGDAGRATEGEALEPTEIHDVLRNDRRRLVLEELFDTEEGGTVRELAEYIASVEAEESPPPRNVRQSVYVSLHQTHLPKLDELGIVSYDGDTKEVRLDDHADAVAVYLDVDRGEEPGDREASERALEPVYIGVGLVGIAALLANQLGVPGVSAVSGGLVGTPFLVLVVALAAYRLVRVDDADSDAVPGPN
jgi:predicted transcriptional regulator